MGASQPAEGTRIYRPPRLLGNLFLVCTLVCAGLGWLVGLQPDHMPFVIGLILIGLVFLVIAIIAWTARIEVGSESFSLICLVRRRDIPLESILGMKINDKGYLMYLQNGQVIKMPAWAADDAALVNFFRKNLQS